MRITNRKLIPPKRELKHPAEIGLLKEASAERQERPRIKVASKDKTSENVFKRPPSKLRTNIKNTKRFMAVNPTNQGYEFEWEELPDDSKKLKPMFKCITPKGIILSGKKFEIVFEYTPDNVGEHESRWVFKIPS